jgi:hypothetical protein
VVVVVALVEVDAVVKADVAAAALEEREELVTVAVVVVVVALAVWDVQVYW